MLLPLALIGQACASTLIFPSDRKESIEVSSGCIFCSLFTLIIPLLSWKLLLVYLKCNVLMTQSLKLNEVIFKVYRDDTRKSKHFWC